MLSMKSFIRRQDYDAPPEVYQKEYEEYQLKYAQEVSDHFFDIHKFDEWFLYRYDPLHLQEREDAARAWARAESDAFAKAALRAPLALLEGCCLEPGGVAAAPLLAPLPLPAPPAAAAESLTGQGDEPEPPLLVNTPSVAPSSDCK